MLTNDGKVWHGSYKMNLTWRVKSSVVLPKWIASSNQNCPGNLATIQALSQEQKKQKAKQNLNIQNAKKSAPICLRSSLSISLSLLWKCCEVEQNCCFLVALSSFVCVMFVSFLLVCCNNCDILDSETVLESWVVPFFHSSRLHNFLQFIQFEKKNNKSAVGFLRQLTKEKGGCFGRCMDGWVGEGKIYRWKKRRFNSFEHWMIWDLTVSSCCWCW
jgi:hypothetical protein